MKDHPSQVSLPTEMPGPSHVCSHFSGETPLDGTPRNRQPALIGKVLDIHDKRGAIEMTADLLS